MPNGNVKKSTVIVPFHADATASITLTDMAAAETILAGSARGVKPFDLSAYKEVRLTAKVATVGSTGSKVRAKFGPRTEFTTTAANYTNLGYDGAAVEALITTAGIADSGWVSLNSAAKYDVNLGIFTVGGDATADPVLDNVQLHFRTPDQSALNPA